MLIDSLPVFCLERWLSLRENYAKILLCESGVEPLTIAELEELYGKPVIDSSLELGYGWTKGSPELRGKIAELYDGVSEDNILVTCGSSEANFLTALATVEKGDTIVVEMPNYMQIPGLLKWRGAKVIEIWRKPERNFQLSTDELVKIIEEYKPKAFFAINPNNPTGQFLKEKELREIAEAANKNNTMLVFDEVYRGLEHDSPTPPSIIDIVGVEKGVVISGLSKVFGLPGPRIGWIVAGKKLIEKLWAIKDYTTIAPSNISDHIATIALSENIREKLVERAKKIVKENKNTLRNLSSKYSDVMRIVWPEATPIFMAEINWAENSEEICEKLFKDYGILITPGTCFNLSKYIRITLGPEPRKYRKDVAELFEALAELKSIQSK
ncbi:MAG: aminotransferase class I/II-fold pyridoxal phosphate-dependent enzyme [Candidatus Baldrarchaeia archaeon]